MKNQENHTLLRNYLAGNAGRAEYQYAVEEINRQLTAGEIDRSDLLEGLGHAALSSIGDFEGESYDALLKAYRDDVGVDSEALAEVASKNFPGEDVDVICDAETIKEGYVDACGKLKRELEEQAIESFANSVEARGYTRPAADEIGDTTALIGLSEEELDDEAAGWIVACGCEKPSERESVERNPDDDTN